MIANPAAAVFDKSFVAAAIGFDFFFDGVINRQCESEGRTLLLGTANLDKAAVRFDNRLTDVEAYTGTCNGLA